MRKTAGGKERTVIEIYEGDGKGKTTAAGGLAVRAAGRGVPVLFAQFLKDGSSGEVRILRTLPEVTVMEPDVFYGFVSRMSGQEKARTKESYGRLFAKIRGWTAAFGKDSVPAEKAGRTEENGPDGTDLTGAANDSREAEIRALVVLDEALHAVRYGFLSEDEMLDWLQSLPEDIEAVLTGRNPTERLVNAADYISEIRKKKHPFDWGVTARSGVEL